MRRLPTILPPFVLFLAAWLPPSAALHATEIPRLVLETGAAPNCSKCSGEATLPCAKCKGEGRRRVSCEVCAGTDRSPCPAKECKDGKRVCRACSGRGTVRVSSIGVTGGSSSRIKNCGECGATGALKCASCRGEGSRSCYKCNGGKKEFTVACEACEGDGRTPCSKCKGEGTVAAPRLSKRVSGFVSRELSSIKGLETSIRKIRGKLDEIRAEETVNVEATADLAKTVALVEDVAPVRLNQYLLRFRAMLVEDWETYRKQHLDAERSKSAFETHVARADGLLATLDAGRKELERILKTYDSRAEKAIVEFIGTFRKSIQGIEDLESELELDVFKYGREVDRMKREARTIRSDIETFRERLDVHERRVAEHREREAQARAAETPHETLKTTLRQVSLETGTPRFKMNSSDSRLEGKALELAVEYVDAKAAPIGNSRFYALDERFLEKLPRLVSALFDAREELAEIRLEILGRVETVGDDGRFVFTNPVIQRFEFGRGGELHGGERELWKQHLARSKPYPAYPPPDLESYGWVRTAFWVGLFALLGLAAWFVVRARRA